MNDLATRIMMECARSWRTSAMGAMLCGVAILEWTGYIKSTGDPTAMFATGLGLIFARDAGRKP